MGNGMNKVCDKCGCTEFVLGNFCIDMGGFPFIDIVYYCKECGEITELTFGVSEKNDKYIKGKVE